MEEFSKLCQLGNGCMGCCADINVTVKGVTGAIELNTKDFNSLPRNTIEDYRNFDLRHTPDEFINGVCYNVVCIDQKVLCPLHPLRHNGEDLRKDHRGENFYCNVAYYCNTVKLYNTWSDDDKKKFLKFLVDKKLSTVEYSIGMKKGLLLRSFNKIRNGLT